MKIVVNPSNVYGVNCSSSNENFHRRGFCASEIHKFFPSYTGKSGAVSSAGNSYSVISVLMSLNNGLICKLKIVFSLEFCSLCASNSICQFPAKPNVASAVYFVIELCTVSETSASIGEMFFCGLETFTFNPEISSSGLSSNDETITEIVF